MVGSDNCCRAIAIDCRACSAAVSAGSITSLTTLTPSDRRLLAIHRGKSVGHADWLSAEIAISL